MDVRLITPQGMERHGPDQIGSLLNGPGLLWIDVAYWDAWTEEKLVKLLGLDPRAARDSRCAICSGCDTAYWRCAPWRR